MLPHTAPPSPVSHLNYVSPSFLLFSNLRSVVNNLEDLGLDWSKSFWISVTVCVLCMVCVFASLTDSREETVLGSIPLPSYVIAPVEPDDHINRKYAFKVTVNLFCVQLVTFTDYFFKLEFFCGLRSSGRFPPASVASCLVKDQLWLWSGLTVKV